MTREIEAEMIYLPVRSRPWVRPTLGFLGAWIVVAFVCGMHWASDSKVRGLIQFCCMFLFAAVVIVLSIDKWQTRNRIVGRGIVVDAKERPAVWSFLVWLNLGLGVLALSVALNGLHEYLSVSVSRLH